jgi:putative ATP-dependent endonuclease of OLD family
MRLSRLAISNFRNFQSVDIALSNHALFVGENQVGKSNLIHAIRLVLDASLSDSSRQLRLEDFWDGLPRPLSKGDQIEISVELTDFKDDPNQLALLCEHLVTHDPMVSRLTYIFSAAGMEGDEAPKEADYEWLVYGGGREDNPVSSEVRRRLPLEFLAALRDAESDLANWRRSPLRPLLDRAATLIDRKTLTSIAESVTEVTKSVTEIDEISELSDRIRKRLEEIGGSSQTLDISLGFSPADADRLLRTLRIFIDDGKRSIGEASLGSANILYLALKLLEIDQLVEEGSRHHTFLAIEEPEAHLHPYLQRLVYRDVLQRRLHQEGEKPDDKNVQRTILLTTHSPHIVSVSPLETLVSLRKVDGATEVASAAGVTFEDADRADLERYLDVSRGEMLFAKGVLLVEGDAEMYLVPALARLIGKDLDPLGIVVCSVSGTHFTAYVRLLHGLSIPFAVITDRDPSNDGDRGITRVLGLLSEIVSAKLLEKYPTEDAQLALAQKRGLFLNDHCLEVDLFKVGRHKSMCRTIEELSDNGAAKTRAKEWAAKPATLDAERLVKDITAIGKGRYAQRLACIIKKDLCPPYIKDAIEYVAKLC